MGIPLPGEAKEALKKVDGIDEKLDTLCTLLRELIKEVKKLNVR